MCVHINIKGIKTFICKFHNIPGNKVIEKESPVTYRYDIFFTKIISSKYQVYSYHVKELYTKMAKVWGKRGLSLAIIKPQVEPRDSQQGAKLEQVHGEGDC